MNHANIADETYDLYVLGVLDAEDKEQIDAHLREGCEYCTTRLQESEKLTAAMAGIAPQVNPPDALRARVLSSVVSPTRVHRPTYWIPALIAACLALLALAVWSFSRNADARRQLAETRNQRDVLRLALAVMSRPDTKAVQFGNLENAPRGRVFVNKHGTVIFIGLGLPNLPAGKSFELWLVPALGAPQAAGVFEPDDAGRAVQIASAGPDVANRAAIAVTIEPRQGSPAPTSKPFLVVPLS
ncbi:MAG TPA: anti-sigma factor [Bryobacteraceae bacterium]|nr:anti-sigma factor [Bryobacteraceae bacterium]